MTPTFEPITEAEFFVATKTRARWETFPFHEVNVVLCQDWHYVWQWRSEKFYKTPASDASPVYIADAITWINPQ